MRSFLWMRFRPLKLTAVFNANQKSRQADTGQHDAARTAGDPVLTEGIKNRRVPTKGVVCSGVPAPDRVSDARSRTVFGYDFIGLLRASGSAGRSLWQLLMIRGRNGMIAIVLSTAVIGLGRFAAHVDRWHSRSHQELEIKNNPTFVLARSEVRHLWLPEAMTWLTKRHSRSPFIRDHEELQEVLEILNLQHLCYAVTIRDYSVNGELDEVTHLRHPYDELCYFPELMDVLSTAAGSPPPYSDVLRGDFSTASVHVVPEEPWKSNPRQFIVEQLRGLSTPGG
jgi:hypothetical protein